MGVVPARVKCKVCSQSSSTHWQCVWIDVLMSQDIMFLDAQYSCHFLSCLFYSDQKHFQMLSYIMQKALCTSGFYFMLVDDDWSHVQTDSLSIIHIGHGKWAGIYIYITCVFIFHQWKVKDPRVSVIAECVRLPLFSLYLRISLLKIFRPRL